MKSTKTILIAALAVGALMTGSSSLLAQDATNTAPAAEHGSGMKGGYHNLFKQLNLTDDQKPKVQEILKANHEKRRALHEDTTLTVEEKKAKVKSIQEDTAAQLKAVLTPEQFAKWQELSKRGSHKPAPASGASTGTKTYTAPVTSQS